MSNDAGSFWDHPGQGASEFLDESVSPPSYDPDPPKGGDMFSVTPELPMPSAPPPPYDEIAFRWARSDGFDEEEATANYDPPLLRQIGSRDREEMDMLAMKLARWSTILFSLGLAAVVAGVIFFDREVGKYSLLNIFFLGVFLLGAVHFYQQAHMNRLIVTEVYFYALWCLVVFGTPVAIYYAIVVPEKMENYCARIVARADSPSSAKYMCNPDMRSTVVGFQITVWVVMLVIWNFVLTAIARVVFVYSCAVERAQKRGPESMRKLTKRLVFLLPNYHSWARRGSALCASSLRGICGGCRCSEACAVLVCVSIFIFSLIMCASLSDSGLRFFFCLVVEIFGEALRN